MLKSTLRGFTIIELAISVAVLSVVASIFAPVIGQGIDAILITRSKEQMGQETRFAMNWITNDLMNNCFIIADLPKPTEQYYPRIGCWTTADQNFYVQYWRGFPVNPLTLVRRTTDITTTPSTIVESVLTNKLRSLDIRGYRANFGYGMIPLAFSNDNWTSLDQVKIIEIRLSIWEDSTQTKYHDLVTRIHPRLLPQ
jgi:prepilin-type N-terminal cleavage/methylation domain-containing protein